jgi:hypothetical protein
LHKNGVPIFQALGLQHTATGTSESPAVDQVRAANHLSQVLQAMSFGRKTGRSRPKAAVIPPPPRQEASSGNGSIQ